MLEPGPSAARAFQRASRDAILNVAVASPLLPRFLRWRVMRAYGLDVGRSSINAQAFIGGKRLTIGDGCFINYQAFIDTAAQVTIGDRVYFGPRVTILTGSHDLGGPARRAGGLTQAPVTIGSGAWLGANVVVLPGVTIGSGAVVAAGAVVTADVEPNTLVGGVPAKVIRRLPGA